jgi:uncharacterized protein (TIGR02996 family)
MSDQHELLKRICLEPDDREARLVYADLLAEQGDARGVFIAHHCQLEQMDSLDADYPALAASTRRLEAAYAPSWLAEYLERAAVEIEAESLSRAPLELLFNAEFRAGFMHRIAMTPEEIGAHWDWLRQREPLQGVELRLVEHLPREYHELAQPAAFRTLKVTPDGWVTANSVGDVLRWGLSQLRELDLSGCDLGLAGAQLLTSMQTDLGEHFEDWTAPPPLPEAQLTTLILHATQLGDEAARLLFDAPTTRALETFSISQCRLDQRETLEALAASPLEKLRSLSIAGNKAFGEQLDALASWPVVAQLRHLALPLSTTAESLGALFSQPSTALRSLDLSSAKVAAAEPETIAACASTLTALDIGTTRIGDVAWGRLLEQSSVEPVTELRANGCSLSDRGIERLANSSLERLLTLDLSSNKLTDKGVEALAAWPGLKHVTFLRIGNNRKVKARGYRALIESPHLDLAVLDVGKLSDESILASLRDRFKSALRVG